VGASVGDARAAPGDGSADVTGDAAPRSAGIRVLRVALFMAVTWAIIWYGSVLAATAIAWAASASRFAPGPESPTGIALHYVLLMGLEAGAALLFWRAVDRRPWAALGLSWRPHSARNLLVGAGCGTAVVVAGTAVAWLAGLVRFDGPAPMEPLARGELLLAYVAAFAAVALVEELVFRGYVLVNLQEAAGRWPGAALAALLFGLYHLPNPHGAEPLNQLSLFLGGMALTLPRLATGSLWLSVGMHFAFDFVLLLLIPNPIFLPGLLDSSVVGPSAWFGGSESTGWIDLAVQGLWLAALWRLLYLPARSHAPQGPASR